MLTERSRRWLKFFLALGITLFFSFLFIRSIDLGEVARALRDANYLYVVPALGLFAVSLLARSIRWRVMYQPQRDLPWQRLLPSLLVGYAGNNLLPLRAGELLRAQHLADREKVPRMLTFGTFLMERLFDFLMISAFVLAGLLIFDVRGAYLGAGLLLGGGSVAGFVVGVVLARNPGLPVRIAAGRWPFVPERLRREAGSLGESFLLGFSALTSASRFSAVLVVSAVAWTLELAMYWVVSMGFGIEADFLKVAAAGSAANVALSLPSAQGGVGPFHVVAKEALSKFGIAGNTVAAYVVALHIFLVAPVSLVGLVVLSRSALPIKEVATPLGAPAEEAKGDVQA
jgi:glycosyltransferase 2 family protein